MLRRLASMLYESILLFAVAFFGTWLFQFAAGTVVIDGWRLAMLQLFLIALFAAYFLWCWLRSGQTLAMKTWRIRLVAKNGHLKLQVDASSEAGKEAAEDGNDDLAHDLDATGHGPE